MLILAVHQTRSLTQERYEKVVRRLTGKSRIESPSDLPFEGLLVHAAGQGRTASASSTSLSPRRRWIASKQPSAQPRRRSGSRSRRSSSRLIPRCLSSPRLDMRRRSASLVPWHRSPQCEPPRRVAAGEGAAAAR
jgi:hypothetical protein